MKTMISRVVMAAVLVAPVAAQGRLRDVAPDFDARFTGSEARSLGDFRGRVVLLDFWRTWCEPCKKEVPHLNALQAKYKDKGLVVIGITNEEQKLVDDAIEAWKQEIVIARVQGSKTDGAYGVETFPYAFLIDAQGRIAWSGQPMMIDESLFPELLAQVIMVRPLPDKFRDVNQLLERRRLGKAFEAIERGLVQAQGDADLARAKTEIEAALKQRLEGAQALADALDFGLAFDAYSEVVQTFAPMAGALEAEAAADSIRRDPAAKDELAAHAQMKKGEELSARGEREPAIQAWKLLVKKYPSTKAAKRAKVALRQRGML